MGAFKVQQPPSGLERMALEQRLEKLGLTVKPDGTLDPAGVKAPSGKTGAEALAEVAPHGAVGLDHAAKLDRQQKTFLDSLNGRGASVSEKHSNALKSLAMSADGLAADMRGAAAKGLDDKKIDSVTRRADQVAKGIESLIAGEANLAQCSPESVRQLAKSLGALAGATSTYLVALSEAREAAFAGKTTLPPAQQKLLVKSLLASAGQIERLGGLSRAIGEANVAAVPEKTTSDPDLLAKSVLAVMSGVPAEVLAEPLKSEVLSLVGRAKPDDPAAMREVYDRCTQALGPDVVARSLGALAVAVNDAAHAATRPVAHKDEVPAGKDDSRDWHRTWGLRLLPDEDPCFRDPAYLVALNQESKGVRATSFEGRTSVTQARERFEAEWAQLAPGTKVMAFAESGSDAVSLCFQIATACGRRRGPELRQTNPEMLFFDGVYGGGRGLAASMNFAGWGRDTAPKREAFKLPSPTSTTWKPTDPAEMKELEQKERAALDAIRVAATEKSPPIGAIFIEPVQGARGVLFYRTEFMLQLRKLADELKLPIIADEVLTSGGRTGKFFAYEHYEGFKPDFVVFGKGLQVAGIAAVKRDGQAWSQVPGQYDFGVTTAGGDAVRMLKGAQVMKRIREGKLMERAKETGAALTAQLREVQKHHGVAPDASGLGLLIGMTHVAGTKFEVSHSWANTRDRYMPPLTLTRDEASAVVSDLMKALPPEPKPAH